MDTILNDNERSVDDIPGFTGTIQKVGLELETYATLLNKGSITTCFPHIQTLEPAIYSWLIVDTWF